MTEYECEVCGIVHVDGDGNEWTDDTDPHADLWLMADWIAACAADPSIVTPGEMGYPSVTDAPNPDGLVSCDCPCHKGRYTNIPAITEDCPCGICDRAGYPERDPTSHPSITDEP